MPRMRPHTPKAAHAVHSMVMKSSLVGAEAASTCGASSSVLVGPSRRLKNCTLSSPLLNFQGFWVQEGLSREVLRRCSLERVLDGEGGLGGGCCPEGSCSCLEVHMCQASASRAEAGRSSDGNSEGTSYGGSGTGAAPPRAMRRCGRQPEARLHASLRCVRRDASVSLRE